MTKTERRVSARAAVMASVLLAGVAIVPTSAHARPLTCVVGTDPVAANDPNQIAALRGVIDAACGCAQYDGSRGLKHRDYYLCAKQLIDAAVTDGDLREDCASTVKKIYRESTCGKNAIRQFVPCVETTLASGMVRCKVVPTKGRDGLSPSSACQDDAFASKVTCPLHTHCLDAADSNGDDLIGLGDSGSCAPQVVTFATQGCTLWSVPEGVSTVQIAATGAAGAGSYDYLGGLGDGYSATVSGLTSGEQLSICVDVGGGSGAAEGGGASGVSLGADFSQPLLVAGGGGGAGWGLGGLNNCCGHGGSAGDPIGFGGGSTSAQPSSAVGGGGGNNTSMQGGNGGSSWYCGFGATGASGSKFTAAGPGHGGAGGPSASCGGGGGGGGGGGYFGGGGGGTGAYGAGGGGGSSFCMQGTFAGGVSVTSCNRSAGAGSQHGAGSADGLAHVVLSY